VSAAAELPRHVKQPGPPPAERIVAVEGAGRAFEITLEAGVPLAEAVRRGFAAHGFAGGTVVMNGVALAPFAYVMPALSKTGENAAFYSDVFQPAGTSRIAHGAMTFGRRDGAPFFHCHALWTEADGRFTGGHILPDGTVMAETAKVQAFGFDGGIFEANPDPETNFKLFGPVPEARSGAATSARAFALRLRPNQDFCGALERFCAERGIARARVRGGVGSTIGAKFTDGSVVPNFATEVYVRNGVVEPGPQSPEATLDVALVDYKGHVAEGRLLRGDNPVLMTFELVLEVL
jgi:predicted DNA-binding protein with PD1-like motif